jgi:hypothetical protein
VRTPSSPERGGSVSPRKQAEQRPALLPAYGAADDPTVPPRASITELDGIRTRVRTDIHPPTLTRFRVAQV